MNDLLLKEEVFQIVGAAIEVLNGLGLRTIPSHQQLRFDVIYKTVKVSEYVPDLIAYGKVVVDAKVIERITDHERGQMLNYLRVTRLPVGVILNFKRAKLEWERLVLSRNQNRE